MQPPGRTSIVTTDASSTSSSAYPPTKLTGKATNPPMSTIVDVDAARPPGSADITLGSVKRSIASLLLHDDAAELLEMTLKPKSDVIGGILANKQSFYVVLFTTIHNSRFLDMIQGGKEKLICVSLDVSGTNYVNAT